jgi:hypothetical protein
VQHSTPSHRTVGGPDQQQPVWWPTSSLLPCWPRGSPPDTPEARRQEQVFAVLGGGHALELSIVRQPAPQLLSHAAQAGVGLGVGGVVLPRMP